MIAWLSRNAQTIEAAAATVTAIVAVAALVGLKIQLDAVDRGERAQSARDTYRAHLALAATQPDLARPADVCALIESPRGGGYVAFVDHLLYSAEQMLSLQEGWTGTFLEQLAPHRDYLCAEFAPRGDTDELVQLLNQFRQSDCPQDPACG